MKMKPRLVLMLITTFLSACKSDPKKEVALPIYPTSVEEAAASPYRNPGNIGRDQYRHPVETLNFFGVKTDMTIIEVLPGAGWYMEILAPLLAEKGQYISAMAPAETSPFVANLNTKVKEWVKSHPELEPKIKYVPFTPPASLVEDGTADMVLTFRNVHNWAASGSAQAAFDSFFKALKKGGVLGVVEHRAHPKSKRDPKAKSGYMHEADVIAMAQKAGFKLDAKTEINANPKDTKNYAQGVWTLPPTLRLGDQDKEKYLAIGESDRMTLRFVKP